MELVNTMEISGEEREIADAYARGHIEGVNNNLSQLEIDLKMLGYTVPKEMPVQNYVDSDGVFHQRVGRVDLGSLSWNRFAQNETVYLFNANFTYGKSDKNANGVCRKYSTFDTNNGWGDMPNNSIGYTTTRIRVRDDSYTGATDFKNAMKGVYLYYELATENTIKVDGNEAVTKVNEDVAVLKSDLSEKLKVISVSLSDVMVSAMSSTTVDLPQEYIDAGYVIANILSKPDTGLSYTTGSETSIIIRNNTDRAVAFAPTTTVKVLIAKIG